MPYKRPLNIFANTKRKKQQSDGSKTQRLYLQPNYEKEPLEKNTQKIDLDIAKKFDQLNVKNDGQKMQ